MKKIFTLILALFLLINLSSVQAQTHFSFGARAGLNISNLSFDPDIPSQITKSSRTGFKFGAMAEIAFIPMLAVQIEPMYTTGGCELSGPLFVNGFTLVNGKATYKVSVLEIPILLKFKIPVAGSIMPYAFVGPNVAFVMSSKELDEPTGFNSSETDQKDNTASTLFSLDFGGGVGFKVTPLTVVMLDVRYSLGLSNMLNDKGKQSSGQTSVKTSGFQVVAGVMFGL